MKKKVSRGVSFHVRKPGSYNILESSRSSTYGSVQCDQPVYDRYIVSIMFTFVEENRVQDYVHLSVAERAFGIS